jgi:glutamyl-tRNA synthetase
MALYNYLYSRKLGGKWIVRIEDTDAVRAAFIFRSGTHAAYNQTRYVPGSVEGIRMCLEWAGLDYDFGI